LEKQINKVQPPVVQVAKASKCNFCNNKIPAGLRVEFVSANLKACSSCLDIMK